MKKNILLGTLVLLVAGCLPSVYPYYTEKDIVSEPRLFGEWQTVNEKEQPAEWKFEPGEGKACKLTVVEEKTKEGSFTATFFKLGSDSFLDITPSDCDYATNQASLVGISMFPGHLLMRVTQIEPELKMAAFDFDWLSKYLDANPKALACHKQNGSVILTGETSALQKFVLAHLGEGELFPKPVSLVRKGKPVPAPAATKAP